MTSDLDEVPWPDVLALDAHLGETRRTRCLKCPRRHLTFVIFDVEVQPGMRHEQMDFLHSPIHCRPHREVIVSMGVVSANRQDGDHSDDGRETEKSGEHGGLLKVTRVVAIIEAEDWAGRRGAAAALETSSLLNNRWCRTSDTESTFLPRRETSAIVGKAPGPARGRERSPRECKGECRAYESRQRFV